jgi:ribose/xylose/arabinose/galactoside ABC-type transport system permease subunit
MTNEAVAHARPLPSIREVLRSDTSRLGAILVVIGAVFTLLSPHFLSVGNFLNIGLAVSITGVASAGVTVALLSGSLDLSFPVVMSTIAVLLANLRTGDVPDVLAVALVLVVAAGCGVVNGVLTEGLRIDALLVTLATATILSGVLFMVTQSAIFKVPGVSFEVLGRGRTLGVPNPAIVLAIVFVVSHVLVRYTRFGQQTLLVGDNIYAARLSGIAVHATRIGALTYSALLAGVAGILLASSGGYATAADGEPFLLPVIAAVVLGGTLLGGGRGSLVNTLLGVLILGTVINGLSILNVSPSMRMVVAGAIVLVALAYYARSVRPR